MPIPYNEKPGVLLYSIPGLVFLSIFSCGDACCLFKNAGKMIIVGKAGGKGNVGNRHIRFCQHAHCMFDPLLADICSKTAAQIIHRKLIDFCPANAKRGADIIYRNILGKMFCDVSVDSPNKF